MAGQPSPRKTVRFKKGDALFRQGEHTNDLYIIKSGSVRIFRTEGTKEIPLDTVGPGMVAGEIAPVDEGIRSATGVAVSDTEAFVISAAEFKIIFEKIPDWFRKIALILVQRLREVDEKIVRSINADHSAYVAGLVALISYSEKAHSGPDGLSIDRKFLEYEIMDLLAIPLAEVQTALEMLAAKKIIAFADDVVVLTDRQACEKLGEEVFR